jgi:uncharacterized protein DUF1905
MKFRATLQLDGKTATGINVPDEVVGALGGGKRPPVHVTINGFGFDTTLGVMKGVSKIPVSAERRQAAGIAAGDEVEVEIDSR